MLTHDNNFAVPAAAQYDADALDRAQLHCDVQRLLQFLVQDSFTSARL